MSRDREELPSGWCTTTLREIAEIVGGVTKDAKKSAGQGFREVPYLRVANVQRGWLDLADVKSIAASESDIQKLRLLPGDILLNEGGDRDKLGRGWIWQGQLPVCIHQNHVFRARLVTSEIDPVYVAHFTNSVAQTYFADQGAQTTNLASISMTKLGALPIVLPPAKEQRRIVAKLDELLSELDAGVAELKTAQAKLQRYRQSLLKAAVQGDLTADWRAAHPPAETGAELLQRIEVERRARWKAAKVARASWLDAVLPAGWESKYQPPHSIGSSEHPRLPAGWAWASLDELAFSIGNGLSKTPNQDGPGTPILRINAVRPMFLNATEVKFLQVTKSEAYDFQLETGDLLATRYNGSVDLLGVVALVRQDPGQLLHPDKLIRIRPAMPEILPEWIEIASNCGVSRQYIRDRVKTTAGQTGIAGSDLRKMPLPLPPLAEQARIIEVVAESLASADALQAAIEKSLAQCAAQRQNILRTAFAGQLVPQDPTDEPADALLARIRAQRAAVVPAARLRKAGGRPSRSVA